MTTFTKVLLNPQRRGARTLLLNPQAMHAAVRSAFPPDISEEDTRVLWRVDHRGHEHTLYIVGPEKPDAANIVEQAGWDTRPAQSADYSPLLDKLLRGQQWRFELVANPVKSTPVPGKRGRITPLVGQGQMDWLAQRAPEAGFRLIDAATTGQDNLRFRRGEGKNYVSLRTARFSGVLEVEDADKLRRTLTHGIGRARAYGCGLLTLAQR
ncbi:MULTISPECIES: type I-E CRISPR-associated protein Cas6/Cse3/CasE [unclassified Corynebacterium]|uniref:type I-E CRISPR-associated protein Cas6/Cse3/CasE n=1 Tax=unclassified Corynebacterium TaxID=2624378 RepID=UPI0029CA7CF1|nr:MULTISPECIES: type I-E CRISPR-associated protein Cas6/Cse3/CasE [unclassified Corynebacterium]WPF66258.1 type I-E CRISPR-associated protein Cas6/Cse3/CasE [Corynebacterium sp. 22KM0430]WPF68748.1 type I-E CRISPR-associated protein Cas6/Cse3/CasE [Corynebacterium sp. 21KM1197]